MSDKPVPESPAQISDEQAVKARHPQAYVQFNNHSWEYLVWSTDDPSEKILGRGAKKYAAWADARSRLEPVEPIPSPVEAAKEKIITCPNCGYASKGGKFHEQQCEG